MPLYTYPSNKLEYLVQVLSKLLDVESKNIFTPSQIIVGSRGMQHWLSMQLAENRDIAMNLKYDMVNGYILDMCYKLVEQEEHKKSYTKKILIWRIFSHIDTLNSDTLEQYFGQSILRKYQLSTKIAEVFSKYLSYRVDWLKSWESSEPINGKFFQQDEDWQMQLWQKLVNENENTPYRVQDQAIQKLSKKNLRKLNVPSDIYIFGVNTISPKNLNFIFELAKHIDVNMLYVNPCSEYWYDLQKDKVSAWLGFDDYENQPLLANLGQQGKEFFRELLLYEEKQELQVFEKFEKKAFFLKKLEDNVPSQLVSIQRNLLELNCDNYVNSIDNTVLVSSCHSPLREVQILHDKLLDMLKKDPSIRPRDILVMCPSIEDYSPYIDSVFSRTIEPKKLPCSIADRTLLDSEPLVASFIDLLQLPESNFEVNKILDYLTVPAIQKKFNISDIQLETIHYWLKESCIHHSINDQMFSWPWGLKRLMFGFSYSDYNEIIDDKLMTIPIIEGSEIAELGGLYELLELLSDYSEQLSERRTLESWQAYLLDMFDSVFTITSDEQYIAKKIKDVIAKTVESANEADKDVQVDLSTIRYCLISQLSEPIINNHFLNGKVTFCSMTPMRNVPFKIIAMLGLNNGKFPRQDSSISFDLMSRLGRRAGDRTKRDDDRYLFLESILSARNCLYLSYVGRNVKTNSQQQSSLILKELINYLKINYSWKDSDIKQYPLHPFSPKSYSDGYRSYDEQWLNILKSKPIKFLNTANTLYPKLPEIISIQKLVKLFVNPFKAFANYSLELYLEDNLEELDDSEPFDIGVLEKYSLKQKLFDVLSNDEEEDLIVKKAKLSGKFPESVFTDDKLESEVFNIKSLISTVDLEKYEKIYLEKVIVGYKLEANCYFKNNQIMLLVVSALNIKHKLELYLTALLFAYYRKENVSAIYYGVKDDQLQEFVIESVDYCTAEEILDGYIEGAKKIVSKPSLSHLSLAESLFADNGNKEKYKKSEKQKQEAWDKMISDRNNYKSLDKDEYFKLFCNESPNMEEFENIRAYKEFFEVINSF